MSVIKHNETQLVNETMNITKEVDDERTSVELVSEEMGVTKEDDYEHKEIQLDSEKSDIAGEVTKDDVKDGAAQKNRKVILAALCMCDLLLGSTCTFMGPFFPLEAEMKGVSGTLTGFIFSSFELVIFVTSPVFGAYMTVLGHRRVLLMGLVMGGFFTILFGLTQFSPPGIPFIVLCFLCRIAQSLFLSAFVNAVFAVIINEFSDRLTGALGLLEASYSLGNMIGPALGGALYEVGGYGLPFYIIGCAIILTSVIACKILSQHEEINVHQGFSALVPILKAPLAWIAIQNVIVGGIGVTFIDPTLAPHLSKFHLSTSVIGLVFMPLTCLYAITAPFWGYLCDKKNMVASLIITANLVCAVGALLMGPSPLLPFLPFKLWVVLLGLMLMGSVLSISSVVSVKCLGDVAVKVKSENAMCTYSAVAGVFNSSYSLGGFAGPALGGFLAEQLDFRRMSTIISGIFVYTSACSVLYFCLRTSRTGRCGSDAGMETDKEHLVPSEVTPINTQLATCQSYSGLSPAEPTLEKYPKTKAAGEKCEE